MTILDEILDVIQLEIKGHKKKLINSPGVSKIKIEALEDLQDKIFNIVSENANKTLEKLKELVNGYSKKL